MWPSLIGSNSTKKNAFMICKLTREVIIKYKSTSVSGMHIYSKRIARLNDLILCNGTTFRPAYSGVSLGNHSGSCYKYSQFCSLHRQKVLVIALNKVAVKTISFKESILHLFYNTVTILLF